MPTAMSLAMSRAAHMDTNFQYFNFSVFCVVLCVVPDVNHWAQRCQWAMLPTERTRDRERERERDTDR